MNTINVEYPVRILTKEFVKEFVKEFPILENLVPDLLDGTTDEYEFYLVDQSYINPLKHQSDLPTVYWKNINDTYMNNTRPTKIYTFEKAIIRETHIYKNSCDYESLKIRIDQDDIHDTVEWLDNNNNIPNEASINVLVEQDSSNIYDFLVCKVLSSNKDVRIINVFICKDSNPKVIHQKSMCILHNDHDLTVHGIFGIKRWQGTLNGVDRDIYLVAEAHYRHIPFEKRKITDCSMPVEEFYHSLFASNDNKKDNQIDFFFETPHTKGKITGGANQEHSKVWKTDNFKRFKNIFYSKMKTHNNIRFHWSDIRNLDIKNGEYNKLSKLLEAYQKIINLSYDNLYSKEAMKQLLLLLSNKHPVKNVTDIKSIINDLNMDAEKKEEIINKLKELDPDISDYLSKDDFDFDFQNTEVLFNNIFNLYEDSFKFATDSKEKKDDSSYQFSFFKNLEDPLKTEIITFLSSELDSKYDNKMFTVKMFDMYHHIVDIYIYSRIFYKEYCKKVIVHAGSSHVSSIEKLLSKFGKGITTNISKVDPFNVEYLDEGNTTYRRVVIPRKHKKFFAKDKL